MTLTEVVVVPDCCVILAAEHAAEQNSAHLASFDEQLTKAASARDLEVVPD